MQTCNECFWRNNCGLKLSIEKECKYFVTKKELQIKDQFPKKEPQYAS